MVGCVHLVALEVCRVLQALGLFSQPTEEGAVLAGRHPLRMVEPEVEEVV